MSMSDILAALLFLLVPLRHSKADRRMAKDTCALIQDDDDNNNNNNNINNNKKYKKLGEPKSAICVQRFDDSHIKLHKVFLSAKNY